MKNGQENFTLPTTKPFQKLIPLELAESSLTFQKLETNLEFQDSMLFANNQERTSNTIIISNTTRKEHIDKTNLEYLPSSLQDPIKDTITKFETYHEISERVDETHHFNVSSNPTLFKKDEQPSIVATAVSESPDFMMQHAIARLGIEKWQDLNMKVQQARNFISKHEKNKLNCQRNNNSVHSVNLKNKIIQKVSSKQKPKSHYSSSSDSEDVGESDASVCHDRRQSKRKKREDSETEDDLYKPSQSKIVSQRNLSHLLFNLKSAVQPKPRAFLQSNLSFHQEQPSPDSFGDIFCEPLFEIEYSEWQEKEIEALKRGVKRYGKHYDIVKSEDRDLDDKSVQDCVEWYYLNYTEFKREPVYVINAQIKRRNEWFAKQNQTKDDHRYSEIKN